MKHTIVAATATAVAALCAFIFFLWLLFSPNGAGEERSTSAIKSLELLVAENTREIAALSNRLNGITSQATGLTKGVDAGKVQSARDYKDILDRLKKLELASDSPAHDDEIQAGLQQSASLKEQFSLASRNENGFRPNAIGEEAFEADSGKPLGDSLENISGVLLAAEDVVAVRNVDCGKSVCKITYAPTSSDPSAMGPNNEADNMLIERLTDGTPGANFDISHARDDQGNSVMYIQLR